MNYQSTTYTSYDGVKLSGYVWKPESTPKAVISLVHGFQEYCDRYDEWAMKFTEKGYAVVGIDYRGHGKSDGRRGHMNQYDDLLLDIKVLVTETRKLFPTTSIILYGQSLGATMVYHYSVKYGDDLKAVIVTSPWLRLSYDPPKVTVFLAKIMARVYPKFTQKADLDLSAMSHDPKVEEEFIKDPLNHEKISSKFYAEAVSAGMQAIDLVEQIKLPTLFMHGSGDRITSHVATKELSDKAKQLGKDVDYKEWEGLYHELHKEYEKEEIFEYIVRWIEKKL